MGIQDIPTSSISSSSAVPTPPPLAEILQSATAAPLSQNPLSGSILKLLADNGFKQKIEAGYAQGHTYTILHSAPSKDFTLIDTWTETRVDESGNTISVPRKKYQIFTITTPVAAPAPIEPAPAELTTPALTTPSTEVTVTEPVTSERATVVASETPPVQVSTQAQTDSARAQTIAEKIKKGGAGMTAEDWQFRNENWSLIETVLTPKAEEAPNTADQITDATTTTDPVVTTTETLPTTTEPETITTKPVAIEPEDSSTSTPESTTSSTSASSLTRQHYDARAWLMQKLKQGNQMSAKPTAAAPLVTSQTASVSETNRTQANQQDSYHLLKKRFSSNTGVAATSPIPPTTSQPEQASPLNDPAARKESFLKTIFGNNMRVWELAQSIPARAFIYPGEYTWGTDEQGKPIERTLEDYPAEARRFRQKIAQSVEDIATQGTPIETTPIGTVLDMIFNKGIL